MALRGSVENKEPRWYQWVEMAGKSLESAGKLQVSDPRSSASRYYYAAYQAMSGLIDVRKPHNEATNKS